MRAALIIAACTLLTACGGSADSPEALLRQWVADAESAAEEKDHSALLALISESYNDGRGNDYNAIGRLLRYYFLQQHSVNLATAIDEITVSGGTAADVVVTVGTVGLDDSTLGINADAYRFHFELENDGDNWQLMGARWAALGQEPR